VAAARGHARTMQSLSLPAHGARDCRRYAARAKSTRRRCVSRCTPQRTCRCHRRALVEFLAQTTALQVPHHGAATLP
jgi:hypothetical protein